MTDLIGRRLVRARPATVSGILLDVGRLPEWNPALLRVETRAERAAEGEAYRAATRVPGRATVTYLRTEPKDILWRIEVAGGVEAGRWRIRPVAEGAEVTHEMSHSGPLLALLRGAMRTVPEMRLDRLQSRAERRERVAG